MMNINMSFTSNLTMKKVFTVMFLLFTYFQPFVAFEPSPSNPNIPFSPPAIPSIQTIQSLPPSCISALANSSASQESCQRDLYGKIGVTIEYYTQKFAQSYSICVGDPVQERNAAFDFRENLTFLTTCLHDTQGSILNRICSGGEIRVYLNSLVSVILSSVTGSASSPIANINCNDSNWSQGCEAGWSKSLLVGVTDIEDLYQNTTVIPERSNLADQPCCEGFFCPQGLGCMLPCPLGARCPRASLSDGICTPYGYQLTPGRNYTCGGANLWASLSASAGLFCPAGSYCPTTTDIRHCDKGHYCRQGSTKQSRCYQLSFCDAQSATQHIQTYGLMLIAGLAVILLFIYNCSNQVRHFRAKRKAKTREKAIQQVKEHFSAVERWKNAVDSVKGLSRRLSGRADNMLVLGCPTVHYSGEIQEHLGGADEQSAYSRREKYVVSTSNDGSISRSLEDGSYTSQSLHASSNKILKGVADNPAVLHTRSQILRYAYGQIEREKAFQSKGMSWNDVLQQAGVEQGNSKRLKIEITFQDLSLFLKGSRKKILCNVTGKLSPGRVTAVMGPSGAGKTTFLNALAGKAYHSYTTGHVLINGKPDPIRCYKKIIGFVPQDDIVHGNLTVEENLWFSARYRLPVDMPKPDKVLVVERIIDALGLGGIRNSKVGTVEKRGISGGQRKRVNVGLEMVMEPSLLILDEPTSGLDSTSSQLVLRALRREALAGVNVGVVLHQPSYGLFKMFDDVMFLAKGGWTVYLGPVDDVENYFATLGIIVPERINPPDHYMDVLEGISKPEGDPQFDTKILPIKWMRYNGYDIPEDLQAAILEPDAPPEKIQLKQGDEFRASKRVGNQSFFVDARDELSNFFTVHWDNFRANFTTLEDLSNRKTPGFWKQFKLICSRLALQRFREARLQTQDYIILLLTGACLGVIAPTKDASLGSNSYAYVMIALSLLCMISALRTFTNDKLEFWRESASGINKVAYFLAKDTVDQFNNCIKPVVFLSMFYYFNAPRSTFVENYIVTLALVYCVVGLAYIFAILVDSGTAQLWAVFLPIISTLIATNKSSSNFMKLLQYVTYTRWALEAYVITNAKRYSGVWLITRCALLYGANFNLNDWAKCLSVLFVMGFVARFIAFLCLIFCNKKRQQ